MKTRHKYFGTPLLYLLLFLLGAIPYFLASYAVDGVFDLLCIELPELFRSYSFASEPEGYERQTRILTAITAALAIFVINYISLSLDNKRFEFLVERTDGRFTIAEGLGLYYREFLAVDIIAAALPPFLLAIPAALIPERLLEYGLRFPIYINLEMMSVFPLIEGTLLVIVISVAARLTCAPLILRRWRVGWLSGSGMEA